MVLFLYLIYSFVIFFILIYIYFKLNFFYWKLKGVPFLEPRIPFGNICRGQYFSFFTKDAYEMGKKKHRFIGAYMFSNPVAVITDLNLISDVLKKDFEYFTDRGVYHNERDDPLSANLLSLDGSKWKNLRAKLTPTFTSGKIKIMFPLIVDVSYELHQTLSEILQPNGDAIEIKELISRFTYDVIGRCAFGIDFNTLKNPNSEFLKMGKKAFKDGPLLLLKRIFQIQFNDLARFLRTKWFPSDVADFFMKIVKDTVEYREKNNIKRSDFMDILIDLKNGKFENQEIGSLTVNEIAAQSILFILAGFETSATTMSYSIYELALNQDLQHKARGIIEDTLRKHNGLFTYDAMMDMEYIDRVITETLRKYPPIPSLLRKATKDYPVPQTNHIIKKRTSVLIPVYAIHHDPEIYPDPEKFDPERFTSENVQERHSSTFLGFGDGLRNCIAARFGRMQSRIGLVTLLRNFKFDKCPKTQIPLTFCDNDPILSAEHGIWVKVTHV